jgi:hypothetical protein
LSAKLLCLKGPYAGQEFPIEEQGIVLGRDPETAGIVIDTSFVSRSHANIFLSPDGRVVLQDLRSTNGTFLIGGDGAKTRVQDDVILSEGRRFSLSANDEAVFEVRGIGEAGLAAGNDGSEVTRTYSVASNSYAADAQPVFSSAPPVPGGVGMPGASPYCAKCGRFLGENNKVCPACDTAPKYTGQSPVQAVVIERRRSGPTLPNVRFKDNFWVNGLRLLGQLLFIISLIAGVIAGYAASQRAWRMKLYWQSIGLFIADFLPFAIGGFLLVAALMIFTEAASAAGKIRHTLENYND